jgi:hypothetical protein
MKSKKAIDGRRYTIEVWMMKPIGGIYRFGLQIWGIKDVFPYAMRLSEEFIEDEIDNDKRAGYLEQVALRVAENHAKDILEMSPHAVVGNLKWWFKEAKRQVDEEGESSNE